MLAQEFVQVKDHQFFLNEQPYRFVGVNLWYAMHLGSAVTGDRARLLKELDLLKAEGLSNVRIMASSDGPDTEPWRVSPALCPSAGVYQEHLLVGLDFVLEALREREMKAVICLSNFWPWSGGMAQLVSWSEGSAIPYPPPTKDGSWLKYMLYTSRFYKDKRARDLYRVHVETIVTRTNSLSDIPYREDPAIMAWQLANEPRAITRGRHYRRWIRETAKLIKELDPNHLVSLGSEGRTPSRFSGNRVRRDHASPYLDYVTAHVWVQNWGWYDPASDELEAAATRAQNYVQDHARIALDLGKPFVLEEFGLARDLGSYQPSFDYSAERSVFCIDAWFLRSTVAAGTA